MMKFFTGCTQHRAVWITLGLFLGLAAWLPVLVSWFSAEELVLLYKVKGHPFGTWSGGEGPGFFRPVVSMIFWLAELLWGTNPRPYHIMSVAFHLANSLLVYLAAREWVFMLPKQVSRASWVAGIAALFFWVWPSHSEPVGWIPGMTDVSAATFALASAAAYFRFRNSGRWPWLIVSLLAYAVGLCTKESVIALPGALFLYEISRGVVLRQWRGRWPIWLACFAIVLLGYLQVRYLATGAYIGGYSTAFHTDFSLARMRLALAPNLANAFLPIPGLGIIQKEIALACLIGLAAMGTVWRMRRGGGDGLGVAALLMAFAGVVVFLPGLNLGPGVVMEGQRFSYLASAFAVMALAGGLVYLLNRKVWPVAWITAVACAAVLCWYNIPRYEAGKMARQIVRDMKKLPPARRVYVLTTTASWREAFIMPHGLHFVGELMVKTYAPQMLDTASTVVNWNPETKVVITKLADDEYRLHLDYPAGTGPLIPRLMAASGIYQDGWFTNRYEGPDVIVHLNGLDLSQDKVAYIQGDKWVVF